MTLLSLLVAIILEQIRPLPVRRFVEEPVAVLARFVEDRLNDGVARHGTIAWCVAVLGPTVLAAVIYGLLFALQPIAAIVFNVVVLYLGLGYRQHSHYYGRIHASLRARELDRARQLLAEWRGGRYDHTPSDEVARLAIEHALVIGHRQVFALFPMFLLFPGPSGVVLYRLSERFAHLWAEGREPGFTEFGRFARRAFDIIDWVPARITAIAFSIMGDFEGAIYCWRTQSALWPRPVDGVLIASGAGALGIQLGNLVHDGSEVVERPEMGTGETADVDFMYSAVGLIRRTLVLFLLVILLVGITGWAGV
jgi:adenosylcobinamide-phosphate synthase